MLYDEPTAGLDPITAGEINDLVLELRKERPLSSIVVTHDLVSAQAISDRVAMLDQGLIVFDGPYQDLRSSDNPFVARFVRKG